MTAQHPPLSPAERARMSDDWSDEAVIRTADEMLVSHGPAVAEARARVYRTAHHNGAPGAVFWSRVIVRLLKSQAEDGPPQAAGGTVGAVASQSAPEALPIPGDDVDGKRMSSAPPVPTSACAGHIERDETGVPARLAFHGAPCASGLRTEPRRVAKKATKKEEGGPAQGSLF